MVVTELDRTGSSVYVSPQSAQAPHHGGDLREIDPDHVRTLIRRRTVLKKAGIIVAVAATGVLGLSSLAFAGEKSGNLSNDCSFPNESGEVTQAFEGGDSLVGAIADVFTGTATNLATQTNTGNCTNLNIEDVIDSDSNNRTETEEKTMIEDSFNLDD
jgi:hypothetical protein